MIFMEESIMKEMAVKNKNIMNGEETLPGEVSFNKKRSFFNQLCPFRHYYVVFFQYLVYETKTDR